MTIPIYFGKKEGIMKSKARALGPVFIVFAAVLWGVDGILRRSLFELPPLTIVFLEHLIGALIIAPFAYSTIKKETFTPKEKASIVWISFFSGVMGTLWFTTALLKTNFIPFSVVFLLQKLQPIFATITAAIVLKEKLTSSYLKWAGLALIAAYFVTFKNGQVDLSSTGSISAALLAIGAAFAWGSSTAFSRYSLLRHSQTSITSLRFVISSIIAFIGLMFINQTSSISLVSPSQLTRLVIIALSTGMVALWIYYKGLKHTQAKVSTIIELAFPLTGVFIDIIIYKTTLAPSQYLAALVLIFAIQKTAKLNQNEK